MFAGIPRELSAIPPERNRVTIPRIADIA